MKRKLVYKAEQYDDIIDDFEPLNEYRNDEQEEFLEDNRNEKELEETIEEFLENFELSNNFYWISSYDFLNLVALLEDQGIVYDPGDLLSELEGVYDVRIIDKTASFKKLSDSFWSKRVSNEDHFIIKEVWEFYGNKNQMDIIISKIKEFEKQNSRYVDYVDYNIEGLENSKTWKDNPEDYALVEITIEIVTKGDNDEITDYITDFPNFVEVANNINATMNLVNRSDKVERY